MTMLDERPETTLDTTNILDTVELMTTEEAEFNESEATKRFLADMISAHGYSDAEAAVLREYANNGRDAMIDMPEQDRRPVEVDLPCEANAFTLTITDHGCGLTMQETKRYHGGFFNTTKNGDPRFAGNMGIGSKVGYSVAKGFTVTTTKDGVRSIVFYEATSDGRKDITPMFHAPVDAPDGTTIQITLGALTNDEAQRWASAAHKIFSWWDPKDITVTRGGELFGIAFQNIIWLTDEIGVRRGKDSGTGSVILMGGTPYPLPESELDERLKALAKPGQRMGNQISFVFEIPNKSMTAQISRESLTFNEDSRAILRHYAETTLSLIHEHNQEVFETLSLPVDPGAWKHTQRLFVGRIDLEKYTIAGRSTAIVPAAGHVEVSPGRGNTDVGSKLVPFDRHFDPTSSKFAPEKTWILTHAGDIKPAQVRLAFMHHVRETPEMRDALRRMPWNDQVMHATIRVDGPEGHELLFEHAGVLDARVLVEARRVHLATKRRAQAEVRKRDKALAEEAKREELARKEKFVRDLATSTSLIETRSTLHGESTHLSLEEIKKLKKPLVLVTNENLTTNRRIRLCALNSRRLVLVTPDVEAFMVALGEHKIAAWDLTSIETEDAGHLQDKEYTNAPKIVRDWISPRVLVDYTHEQLLEGIVALRRHSQVPLKEKNLKRFLDAVESTGLIEERSGRYDRTDRRFFRSRPTTKLSRYMHELVLVDSFDADDTQNTAYASDFITYVNHKKVVITDE